jgi:hypothetical protein
LIHLEAEAISRPIESIRVHARDLGRWRAVAHHLGKRRERSEAHPQSGEALETIEMPLSIALGLESNASDQFFCRDGNSGKVTAGRRPSRSPSRTQ